MAVLKIVFEMWKADAQNKNAIQIAERAGELYDKIVNFLESLNDVGEFIKKAEQSHAKALKQLATGKGNAMKKAQELKEMGANTSKSIPTKFLNEEEGNDPTQTISNNNLNA
jgi:DNA recombination protein RmuC